jgi:hypothetical protein
MISDWEDMMSDTVTLAAVSSRDAYGKPSYGTARSYSARVVYKQTRIVNRTNGQDAIATGVVWVGGTPTIGIDDRMTLPDGTTPVILNWERPTDEDGAHHTKVYFGPTTSGAIR